MNNLSAQTLPKHIQDPNLPNKFVKKQGHIRRKQEDSHMLYYKNQETASNGGNEATVDLMRPYSEAKNHSVTNFSGQNYKNYELVKPGNSFGVLNPKLLSALNAKGSRNTSYHKGIYSKEGSMQSQGHKKINSFNNLSDRGNGQFDTYTSYGQIKSTA